MKHVQQRRRNAAQDFLQPSTPARCSGCILDAQRHSASTVQALISRVTLPVRCLCLERDSLEGSGKHAKATRICPSPLLKLFHPPHAPSARHIVSIVRETYPLCLDCLLHASLGGLWQFCVKSPNRHSLMLCRHTAFSCATWTVSVDASGFKSGGIAFSK